MILLIAVSALAAVVGFLGGIGFMLTLDRAFRLPW